MLQFSTFTVHFISKPCISLEGSQKAYSVGRDACLIINNTDEHRMKFFSLVKRDRKERLVIKVRLEFISQVPRSSPWYDYRLTILLNPNPENQRTDDRGGRQMSFLYFVFCMNHRVETASTLFFASWADCSNCVQKLWLSGLLGRLFLQSP